MRLSRRDRLSLDMVSETQCLVDKQRVDSDVYLFARHDQSLALVRSNQ